MPDIRPLSTIEEMNHLAELEIAIWGLAPKDVVSGNIVRAITLNGGVAHGAFDGGQMVGMALALAGVRSKRRILWSHMAGVLPAYQRQGIGFALKLAQRDWALSHGYDEMRWTFDPIQRGNAHFNLHLLGCSSDTYHEDFYGRMEDSINVSAPTDRLEAIWHLRDLRVRQLAAGELPVPATTFHAEALILKAVDGNPKPKPITDEHDKLFIEIPRNIRGLEPATTIVWRLALRAAFQDVFQRGYHAVDLLDDSSAAYYVLARQPGYTLYILRCADDTLYTGIARDVEARIAQHNTGKGAAYTASRRPVTLLATWAFTTRSAALKAEYALKKLPRQQKVSLVETNADFQGGRRLPL
jgi:predicted GNAT superfamily acetyltransferase